MVSLSCDMTSETHAFVGVYACVCKVLQISRFTHTCLHLKTEKKVGNTDTNTLTTRLRQGTLIGKKLSTKLQEPVVVLVLSSSLLSDDPVALSKLASADAVCVCVCVCVCVRELCCVCDVCM
jgi:hypothetical protein